MKILTIRTDKEQSEIGVYSDSHELHYIKWTAHRQLAESIHQQIRDILYVQGLSLYSIEGIVVFKGPGSFTGLRIGLSVANAMAYSLGVPIVAARDDWKEMGIKRLLSGENDKVALPEYGAPAHTTQPKK